MTNILLELGLTEAEYLSLNPDAQLLGMSASDHFQIFGRRRATKPEITAYIPSPKGQEGGVSVGQAALAKDPGIDAPAAVQSSSSQEGGSGLEGWARAVDFDPEYYLRQYPDVAAAGLDPRWHYFDSGWKEGRNPNSEFSVSFYLGQYPDVAEAGIEPLGHFAESGAREGRYWNFRAFHKGRAKRTLSERTPLFLLSRSRSGTLPPCTIAVHVHCYFLDVFESEILKVLRLLPRGFALFVSVTTDTNAEAVKRLVSSLDISELDIKILANRGRDLAPLFVDFLERIQPYDVCLHLHTKKSLEKADFGTRWLADLNRTMFASSDFIHNTLRLLMDDPTIGLLGPRPYPPIRRFMGWGANYVEASRMAAQLGAEGTLLPRGEMLDFPAGSFFWFRPSAFSEVSRLGLTTESFPAEPIPDDGTIAHALERLLPVVASCKGGRYVEVAPLPCEAEHPATHPVAVSVIIPAFNAGRFIEQAVLSVVRQSCFHVKMEIIVVDNNSTDHTVQVLERLKRVVPNLIVLSEKTPGAGAARNRGLREAKGTFVTFLDADDMLLDGAIGELFDAALASGEETPDFVTSSLQMFRTDWLSHSMPYEDDGRIENLDLTKLTGEEPLWSLMASDFGSCTKLYLREFIENNDITYPEGLNFEDNYFVGSVMMEASRATILRSVTYLYRKSQPGETQSTNPSPDVINDQIKVIELLLERYEGKNDHPRWRVYKKALIDKLRHEANRVGVPIQDVLKPQNAPLTYRAYFTKTARA